MTNATRLALDGAIELARREGFQVWGFCNRYTDIEDEVEFFRFDNCHMDDGEFLGMTKLGARVVAEFGAADSASQKLDIKELD